MRDALGNPALYSSIDEELNTVSGQGSIRYYPMRHPIRKLCVGIPKW